MNNIQIIVLTLFIIMIILGMINLTINSVIQIMEYKNDKKRKKTRIDIGERIKLK